MASVLLISAIAALLLPQHPPDSAAAALRHPPQPFARARPPQLLTAPDATAASVLFIVDGDRPSLFGATSPEPSPAWRSVAAHLAGRLPDFDSRLSAGVVDVSELDGWTGASGRWDMVVAVGVHTAAAAPAIAAVSNKAKAAALVCYDCDPAVSVLQRVGDYFKSPGSGAAAMVQAARTSAAPWSSLAQGRRLSAQADLLFSRHSSEDLLYAIFFILHARTMEIKLVRHTINPTWEKGPLRNAAEFAAMTRCCGGKIYTALSDPKTKATVDLLNQCDSRDQVGSYRIIVSYETPQLEDFSLCILQQNNVFGCDADIISSPRVPLLSSWRGKPLDTISARQILIGHLDHREASDASQKKAWSWKVVCGANPAYDKFPAQHQVFYPSDKSKAALWYDPVFKVETLDGRQVWAKRHYRCMPRQVDEDLRAGTSSAGAWTLSTLDNGVISNEHWTTVDAADDLSWAVLHYSGAAAVVGQSYLGGLLCSADGRWPESARRGDGLRRIRAAFGKCGIQLWELYGHGPPLGGEESGSRDKAGASMGSCTSPATASRATGGGGGDATFNPGAVGHSASFMWTPEHDAWARDNPPPLTPIGDQSVQAWRKAEKERQAGKSMQGAV